MKSSSYVDLELNLTFDLQVVINSGASMVVITASLGIHIDVGSSGLLLFCTEEALGCSSLVN